MAGPRARGELRKAQDHGVHPFLERRLVSSGVLQRARPRHEVSQPRTLQLARKLVPPSTFEGAVMESRASVSSRIATSPSSAGGPPASPSNARRTVAGAGRRLAARAGDAAVGACAARNARSTRPAPLPARTQARGDSIRGGRLGRRYCDVLVLGERSMHARGDGVEARELGLRRSTQGVDNDIEWRAVRVF